MPGVGRLVSELLTRDERMGELATRWLGFASLLAVRRRKIGTGPVGGKAMGMLIARAILLRSDPAWADRLEPHDSWFVGADAYSEFLERNGCPPASLRGGAGAAPGPLDPAARIRAGTFPAPIVEGLEAMLDHFGEAPLVIRSSSLLEDGFENAFTGTYDSVFCANRGTPAERLAALLSAIRRVYASAVGERALRYRERRGLVDVEERMAVLVQRVSGAAHGELFFPHVAGVALSYNPWAWSTDVDPRAGMARIVFGLGTRAVDRADDDPTRLVALDAPLARPGASAEDPAAHAQARVDVVDLAARRLDTRPFADVARAAPELPLDLFAAAAPGAAPVLTFDKLLAATPFVEWVRAMVRTLARAHGFPVEIELTANFDRASRLRVNLVQCRPLQLREGAAAAPPPAGISDEEVLLATRGPIVGRSTSARVDRVVYVDPEAYDALAPADRHEVARVVGRATSLSSPDRTRVLLAGPGRWGTRTISVGVPTSFAEIQGASAVCEIVGGGSKVMPEASLGSHFFAELVEADILYLAVHPGRPGHRLASELLRGAPNRLPELLPRDARLAAVVRIVDFPHGGRALRLGADFGRQEAVCWLERVAP